MHHQKVLTHSSTRWALLKYSISPINKPFTMLCLAGGLTGGTQREWGDLLPSLLSLKPSLKESFRLLKEKILKWDFCQIRGVCIQKPWKHTFDHSVDEVNDSLRFAHSQSEWARWELFLLTLISDKSKKFPSCSKEELSAYSCILEITAWEKPV